MKRLIWLGMLLLSSSVFANDGYIRMEALDNKIKNALLTRAIAAHEMSCETVTKSIAQGEDENGDGYWTAFCADGEAYSVRVSKSENTAIRVSLCDDVPESRLACTEDTTRLAAE